MASEKRFLNAALHGPASVLLPFTEALICDDYIRWLNTPDVNRFLEVRYVRQSRETATTFVRNSREDPMRYFWGIQIDKPGRLVGTASLTINPEAASGEIGLMIGEKDAWGKGVSNEVIDLIAQFAFGALKLGRVTGGTYAVNAGMNFTFKQMGFRLENVLRKHRQIEDGTFVDEFRWSATSDGWKIRHPLKLAEAPGQ